MKLLKIVFAFIKSFFVGSKDFEVKKDSSGDFPYALDILSNAASGYYHKRYSGRKKYVKAPRIKKSC